MKKLILAAGVVLVTMSSCSTVKKTMWVSGFKAKCDMGAGKGECLVVEESGNENGNRWTTFYAPIEGFQFTPGIMQKIRVKEQKIDKKNVAQDASNIRYTLLKVENSKPDTRAALVGSWFPVQMNGNTVAKSDNMPELNFDMIDQAVYGTDGCNNFRAAIDDLSLSVLKLKPAAGTKKACPDMTTANVFNQALGSIEKYSIANNQLRLIDEFGKIRMVLERGQGYTNDVLSGSWVLVRLGGGKIDRSKVLPTLEFDLADGVAVGNDGCNNYRAPILNSSETALQFGVMAGTEKACMDMATAKQFDMAMTKVASYKMDKDILVLMDASGKEVLAFMKRN